jgi:hypothetical protein
MEGSLLKCEDKRWSLTFDGYGLEDLVSHVGVADRVDGNIPQDAHVQVKEELYRRLT